MERPVGLGGGGRLYVLVGGRVGWKREVEGLRGKDGLVI